MPRRVMIVTTDSRICGTERMILSLLQHLDRRRYEPMLVTLMGPGDLVEEARKLGVEALNLRRNRRNVLSLWWRWQKAVRSFQPDIVHSFLFHSNLIARLTRLLDRRVSVISGIRTVYTVEAYGRLYACLERWTHGLDRFYVANSDLGLRSAREGMGLPAGKLVVIRNGMASPALPVSPEEARRRVREEFGYGESDVVVGIVAQLRPAKRHDILIRAASRLKNKHPEMRLLIVGQSDHRESLERLAETVGVAAVTTFTGFRGDVPRLLHGMDIFALPSEVEGQPVSIMEAMLAGLPVAATRVGGIPEITEEKETAFLAEPGDEAGFEEILDQLLTSTDLRLRMGQSGRKRIETLFGADTMAMQFQQLYDACPLRSKSPVNTL